MSKDMICPKCYYSVDKWVPYCPKCRMPYAFGLKPRTVEVSPQNSPFINSKSVKKAIIKRIPTELIDSVLRGGIARGTADLWHGGPGCGKTTIALQCAGAIAKQNKVVVFLQVEEILKEQRGRLSSYSKLEEAYDSGFYFLVEKTWDGFLSKIKLVKNKIDIVFVDSVNALEMGKSLWDKVQSLTNFAHKTNTAVVMIMHVNKGMQIAGRKDNEHLVDGILEFSALKKGTTKVVVKKGRYYPLREEKLLELHEGIGFEEPTIKEDKNETQENAKV